MLCVLVLYAYNSLKYPTLSTALCCNVSSLNSFQELVIGEKSLDGTPENNLFIPGKDKEGFILTRLLEEVDILLQGGMIMVRKKAFLRRK